MNSVSRTTALTLILSVATSSASAYRYTSLQNGSVSDGTPASQIDSLAPRLHPDVDENTTNTPLLLSFDELSCVSALSCDSADFDLLRSAVAAATNRWNRVLNNTAQGVSMRAATSTGNTNPCTTDGSQVIGFSLNNCDSSSWPSGLLAVATSTFQALGNVGAISELDIAINPNENWGSFDGNFNQNGQIDLNRVILHELGHTIGLDHPDEYGDSVSAIMNATAGNQFELQADDIAGDQDLANAIEQATEQTKGGLINSAGFSGQGDTLTYTVTACFLEAYYRSTAVLPDGEIALILTKTNNVNEANRHVTGRSGPADRNGNPIGFFDRNLDCPEREFQGEFVQPPDAGNYFQHLGLFLLDGSLLDSVTFNGTSFFRGGGPTPSPSATTTPSPSPSPTSSPSPTATPSPTPSPTPAATVAPSATATPMPSPSPSASPTPSATATPTITATPGLEPSASPSPVNTSTPPSITPAATASPQPTANADAEGDDISQAKPVDAQNGATVSARIDRVGDPDFFSFNLSQRRVVTISSAGSTDVEALLLDSEGNLLAANDDAGQRAKNFSLNQDLAAGRYFVKVTGVMNATGPYTLSISSEVVAETSSSGGGSGGLSGVFLLFAALVVLGRRCRQERGAAA